MTTTFLKRAPRVKSGLQSDADSALSALSVLVCLGKCHIGNIIAERE